MIKRIIPVIFFIPIFFPVFAGEEILDIARLTNDYFMAKYADPTEKSFVGKVRPSHIWTRGVYYEGLTALNEVAPEKRYDDYIDRWGKFHQWKPNGVMTLHADNQCCAQTYLDRYFATGDTACMTHVIRNLDHQISTGRNNCWTWIDAIQMAMPVYSKAYRATSDRRYLDYAMDSYRWSRNQCGGGLFNETEGLWWRDKDYVPPYKEADGKNCYWSRGNGWVYAALVRVMDDMDPADPYYDELKKDFLAMSHALMKCQRSDGFWNVSLVSPVTFGGPEMTGTALFLYGMSWGLRHGYLDKAAFLPVCDKAWRALESCVHPNGFLGYNQGTGKDPSAGQPVTFTSIPDFEDYGTGCFLLGATEYYKLLKSGGTQAAGGAEKLLPVSLPVAKAGTRWWWPGSAVNEKGLKYNLDHFADAGIGTVEITPIYGARGHEDDDIPYLSEKWMQSFDKTLEIASGLGIQVDMNNGTGWPFGGPEVTADEAACRVFFVDTVVNESIAGNFMPELPDKEKLNAGLRYVGRYDVAETGKKRVIAVYTAPTGQKVKRAAPGGEGLVIDHFDRNAVKHYLERFDNAFAGSGSQFPATFFNDSYEVYGANWTPTLFEEFAKRRGYRLEDRLPELIGDVDDGNKTLADYRETLSDLLYENFTCQWTDWAHGHGVSVRNQAHGSPANLLDIYGAVDIPEIEGFGLSEFNIAGLRSDPGNVRKNDSDVSMLKYASSAAHVMGKPLVSSETFTWLTEHFRTSLSQMKPDLDLMFTCGVNRVFFHGSCYSPDDEEWPGWRFYASVDMTPANSIWRDAPALLRYIERCQSFLQMGGPDNDFLVYLPVRDLWRQRIAPREKGLLMQFDIHSMKKKAPRFIESILKIDSLGFDCDYISDRQLAETKLIDGELVTRGGARYKALVIPTGTTIAPELQAMLENFDGRVIYGEEQSDLERFAKPELMKKGTGLRAIRRSNPTGHHYFIANLSGKNVNMDVPLAVEYADAFWFDPMTGKLTKAVRDSEGKVSIDLKSGESRILRTFNQEVNAEGVELSSPFADELRRIDLTPGPWNLEFIESYPPTDKKIALEKLSAWENLGDSVLSSLMGTGVYTKKFNVSDFNPVNRWTIDLGDVRESARVFLNGKFVGIAWAAPFILDATGFVKPGENTLRIEVTNLPANRIARMDREGKEWRKMKEINVVDINYKKTSYSGWKPVESGLNSTVTVAEWK